MCSVLFYEEDSCRGWNERERFEHTLHSRTIDSMILSIDELSSLRYHESAVLVINPKQLNSLASVRFGSY
jgi:hypothetical protein